MQRKDVSNSLQRTELGKEGMVTEMGMNVLFGEMKRKVGRRICKLL